jgi:hypothetical protein
LITLHAPDLNGHAITKTVRFTIRAAKPTKTTDGSDDNATSDDQSSGDSATSGDSSQNGNDGDSAVGVVTRVVREYTMADSPKSEKCFSFLRRPFARRGKALHL